MKKYSLSVLALSLGLFFGCGTENDSVDEVSAEVYNRVAELGFNTEDFGILKVEGGYLVENDIFLSDADLKRLDKGTVVPSVEQYRTTNLVNAGSGRVIKIYAPVGGTNGYSAGMIAGLDEAIRRYNAMGLAITFQRLTTSSGANITMSRLTRREERQGVLGSAGFPTASGDPYNQIKMSGVLESSYGLSTNGIATIIAHEMGHCIGFRHTDYYNRAISCGGSASNEGDGGVGAILIPGTPSTATASAKSWMLACTDGSDRPFNNDDQVALNYLY